MVTVVKTIEHVSGLIMENFY